MVRIFTVVDEDCTIDYALSPRSCVTDRLLNNPWAQAPLPSDWEVHPTYPRHAVPYYLAPLWDAGMASRALAGKSKRTTGANGEKGENPAGKVPRELREKLKRARGARGLLQDLEEEVRKFVKKWEEQQKKLGTEKEEVDSEDEEIVFVGRNGLMDDIPSPRSMKNLDEELERDKLVFDSLVDDHGASFGYVSSLPSFLPAFIQLVVLPTNIPQPLASPLNSNLLRPPHMVRHGRRPGQTRSIRRHRRSKTQDRLSAGLIWR